LPETRKGLLSVLLLTGKQEFGKKEGLLRLKAQQSFFFRLYSHCKPL
jgi:hypothetical protein